MGSGASRRACICALSSQSTIGVSVRLRDRGAHLQRHVEIGWSPILEVAEEGLDPRQADVACRDAIVALALERFEEGKDRRDREILDLQHTGANAALSGDEQDEQLEAVGVAGDGMAADAAALGAGNRAERPQDVGRGQSWPPPVVKVRLGGLGDVAQTAPERSSRYQ